ncbi:hypothetical protein I553_1516 [Mycobacterium xenopi 4042]|uniref:Uncharacterized protein n=1 Tax=Mycobacterium xenopi 4042 TaxID=1299334 RepID=X8CE12_MYCXE|nr:hypothetical protein I553_1516 [Mycobacterium xenopi 4042]
MPSKPRVLMAFASARAANSALQPAPALPARAARRGLPGGEKLVNHPLGVGL